MANIIKPKTPLKEIDPINALKGAGPGSALIASLFNVAAVVGAEHLRSYGFRGHHSVFTVACALAGAVSISNKSGRIPGVSTLDGLRYAEREREAWPDDLQTTDGWELARALVAVSVLHGTEEVESVIPAMPKQADLAVKWTNALGIATTHLGSALMLSQPLAATDPKQQAAEMAGRLADAIEGGRMNDAAPFLRATGLMITNWLAEHGADAPMSLPEAWSRADAIFNPVADQPLTVGVPAHPSVLKARRLAAGSGSKIRKMLDTSIAATGPMLTGILRIPGSPIAKALEICGARALLNGDYSQCTFSTFMTAQAYEQFEKSGSYQSVWERGPSWHHRYNDQPLMARGQHEMRLMGERGDGITYGYLTTCAEWHDEVARAGMRAYGEVEVVWKLKDMPRFCTYSIEDSHTAQIILDVKGNRLLALLSLMCATFYPWQGKELAKVHGALRNMFAGSRHAEGVAGRYIEFQCHAPLTPADVEEVIFSNP